jgi:YfiH family protein
VIKNLGIMKMSYSKLLNEMPNVCYGFGSKLELLPSNLVKYQATQVSKKQTHGTNIEEVQVAAQNCGETDGLITSHTGVLLSVVTADCIPILFCRRDCKRVGIVHAGWRGLLGGIIEKMILQIEHTDSVSDWLAVVGPAAGPCCYEVSSTLITQFHSDLDIPEDIISPISNHLDLPGIAIKKFIDAGFYAIENIKQCTICKRIKDDSSIEDNPFKFNSYRRDNNRLKLSSRQSNSPLMAHQYSGIVIT